MVEAQRMGDDTYVILGHGYAKDSENGYLNGQVLPWVDPYLSLKRWATAIKAIGVLRNMSYPI